MRKLISFEANQSKEQYATTLITLTAIVLLAFGLTLLVAGFIPQQDSEQELVNSVFKLAEEKGWDRFKVTNMETMQEIEGGMFPS